MDNHEAQYAQISRFLDEIASRGVRLWSDAGRIRFKGPKGAVSNSDLERLKEWRDQLPRFLDRSCAPLAFSQLAQWHRERLYLRCGVRSISSVLRLSGPLDARVLGQSISEVVERHEALRTRIGIFAGEPRQKIDAVQEREYLMQVDATSNALDISKEPQDLLEQLVLEPVNVEIGPLFVACLLKLADVEHVLVLTMEHLISDNVSKNILARDVFTAYTQLLRDGKVSWPSPTLQFPEYARLQRQSHYAWLARHAIYWTSHMEGCGRTRFPRFHHAAATADIGWGTARIHIENNLTTRLHNWCRAHSTTMPMAVFTAYIAAVLRWCEVSDTVVQFQSDGRSIAGAENAIGSFACSLYLRVHLRDGDDFMTLMEHVTEEFCAAYEHQDFAYTAAQQPPAQWTRNTVFNWMPEAAQFALDPENNVGALAVSPLHFPNPWLETLEWDNEPTTALHEAGNGIAGSVHFARQEHSDSEMEQFAAAVQYCVACLLDDPRVAISRIQVRPPLGSKQ